MDRSALLLTFAIVALYFSNTFSETWYFYPVYIILLNIIGLASAIMFFIAYTQRGKRLKPKININPYMLGAILVFFLALTVPFLVIPVGISIVGLYAISLLAKKIKDKRLYYCAAVIIILASGLVYLSIYNLRGNNWRGIDEVAYNYYASYALIHGQNPYTTNMMPILTEHNITPTYLLNGSIETAYDYPAFSFLPVIFIGLFNPRTFTFFIVIVALIAIFSAFLIYRKSNYNMLLLLPIIAWLALTYLLIVTIDQYLAVAVFLLIAYMERKNTILAGLLIGLAASTIQLAWFAIPFFLILALREQGSKKMFELVIMSLLVFGLVNSYFIAIGPSNFLNNALGLFGSSKLLLSGTDIMQVFVRTYGVTLWASPVISIMALLVAIVLFYFYTSTLKPFLAIVPAFIFMLSWRNLLLYSLPFVPILIYMCYERETRPVRDIIRQKSYIAWAFTILIILSIAIVVYAHSVYVSENRISINYIEPVIYGSSNGLSFNGIRLSVTNNADRYENVSFFIINRYPPKDGIFLSKNLSHISPYSSINYTLNYNVSPVVNKTYIYVMAFSSDYITTKEVTINATH